MARRVPQFLIFTVILLNAVFDLCGADFKKGDLFQFNSKIVFGNDLAAVSDFFEGDDGWLYGVSQNTLFKTEKSGDHFTKLHEFSSILTNGVPPVDGYSSYRLLKGPDGYLYGACLYGGRFYCGAIYKVKPDGKDYTVIFAPTNSFKLAAIGDDGFLYGTMLINQEDGYTKNLFKVSTNGNDFALLCQVPNSSGESDAFGLVLGSDGWIYGTCSWLENDNDGIIYRVRRDGSGYANVHEFHGSSEELSSGWWPTDLREGPDGKLYGTAATFYRGNRLIYSIKKNGDDFTVLQRGVWNDRVDVSPEGWITAIGDTNIFYTGVTEVFKMRLDGSKRTVFGMTPKNNYFDYWSGFIWGKTTLEGDFYGMEEGKFSDYYAPFTAKLIRYKNFQPDDFASLHQGDLIFSTDKKQLALWSMNGADPISTNILPQISSTLPSWHFLGGERLAGPGQSVIFWQSKFTGRIGATLLDGLKVKQTVFLKNPNGLAFFPPVKIMADYDHDGWQDFVTVNLFGAISVYRLNGFQIQQVIRYPSFIHFGWNLAGTQDFYHDGRHDLLLTNGKGDLAVQTYDLPGAFYIHGGVWLQFTPDVLAKPAIIGSWDFSRSGSLENPLAEFSDGRLGYFTFQPQNIGPGVNLLNNGQTIPPGWHLLGIVH